MPVVSFLSDFGLDDEFVGTVHGVIARIAPDVRVIDVTHGVGRGSVRAGALALLRAIQYLPDGVILAVVDPGVGGERRPVALQAGPMAFVGPDNGVLAPAVAMKGGAVRAVVLDQPAFRLRTDGSTFEGRDVFAPAAAVLASGEATLDDVGSEVDPGSLTPLLFPLVEVSDSTVDGEVWWVDRFGNCQTNISEDDLRAIGLQPGDVVRARLGARAQELPWGHPYDAAHSGGMIHIDSHGLVAVVVPGDRADDRFGLSDGLSVGFSRA